jgi:alkylated DNA repair dioxygenase AlkB
MTIVVTTLFTVPPPSVPGLSLRLQYITPADEVELARLIDALPWDTTWDRRRQLYGRSYGKAASEPRPIPDWGQALIERMFAERICDRPFDQMLVNEYLPGQGIALHRDYDPYDRTVGSLSLLAPCLMELRRITDGEREYVWLERRSLLILSDEARYEWEHGIARRKSDRLQGMQFARRRRLSITFRMSKLAR